VINGDLNSLNKAGPATRAQTTTSLSVSHANAVRSLRLVMIL